MELRFIKIYDYSSILAVLCDTDYSKVLAKKD